MNKQKINKLPNKQTNKLSNKLTSKQAKKQKNKSRHVQENNYFEKKYGRDTECGIARTNRSTGHKRCYGRISSARS